MIEPAHSCDCDTAIVGGVNAVLAPGVEHLFFSQARMLAQDGRCKAFDSRAGRLRAQRGRRRGGAQAVVARDRGRRPRIRAGRGRAVNHDGRSNGLLAPNGLAQQDGDPARARGARASAQPISDYVEAHGVGAPVADAVELHALGAVMAERPTDNPLLVGSAKTNVGHLEAASGMVSLIKVALALQNEEIPAHLHLRDPHPDIGLAALPIEIPTIAAPWRRGERPRFAGASTFGFGGSNAHVVLREAPLTVRAAQAVDRPRHVVALSAKSDAALHRIAARLAHRLRSVRDEALADVAFSANSGRSHFAHRLAVGAGDVSELRELLERFARGGTEAGLRAAQCKPGARLLTGFVFGEAPVTPGLGRALYDGHPQFKQALDLCDHLLRDDFDRPLLDVLYGEDSGGARLLCTPSYAHAALVSLHYALHALLRGMGRRAGGCLRRGPGRVLGGGRERRAGLGASDQARHAAWCRARRSAGECAATLHAASVQERARCGGLARARRFHSSAPHSVARSRSTKCRTKRISPGSFTIRPSRATDATRCSPNDARHTSSSARPALSMPARTFRRAHGNRRWATMPGRFYSTRSARCTSPAPTSTGVRSMPRTRAAKSRSRPTRSSANATGSISRIAREHGASSRRGDRATVVAPAHQPRAHSRPCRRHPAKATSCLRSTARAKREAGA